MVLQLLVVVLAENENGEGAYQFNHGCPKDGMPDKILLKDMERCYFRIHGPCLSI